MTLFELSKDQVRELRENYVTEDRLSNIFDENIDDVTDEMLIERYGSVDFTNEDFMAKPRECVDNYCVGKDPTGIGEIECCPHCGEEVELAGWNIAEDGFKAYCPYCGEVLMLCDACYHRFGEFGEGWQNCVSCPFMETGFAEDDVYDWVDLA